MLRSAQDLLQRFPTTQQGTVVLYAPDAIGLYAGMVTGA